MRGSKKRVGITSPLRRAEQVQISGATHTDAAAQKALAHAAQLADRLEQAAPHDESTAAGHAERASELART